MQFKASFAALVACLPAIARAMPNDVAPRAADADAYIFVCRDAFNGPPCQNLPVFYGICTTFPTGVQNTITTAIPNPNLSCTFFVGQSCTGRSLTLAFPGTGDLTTFGGGSFNDVLNSVLCTNTVGM